jgi:hypothetical protein
LSTAKAADIAESVASTTESVGKRGELPPPTVLFGGQVVEELSAMRAARLVTVRELEAASRAPFPLDTNTLGAIPVSFSKVLERWRSEPAQHGLLALLAKPLTRALGAIFEDPRTVIARTHEMLQPHKVREMDTRSLQKLARLPGYTVRQKLASTRHVRAPVRYKSCDTTENKLVKQLAVECVRAITNGKQQLDEREHIDELSKRCEEILAAGSPFAELTPDVTPRPNNTLLSDQNYGFVWRCFRAIRDVPDYWAAAWDAYLAVTTEALATAILSNIVAREHVWFEDRMMKWSSIDHARLHTWDGKHFDGLELFVLDDIPRRLSVRIDREAGAIDIETSLFIGNRLEERGSTLRVCLTPRRSEDGFEEDRGLKFDVSVYSGEDNKLIDLLELVADFKGVTDLAAQLCDEHFELPPVCMDQRPRDVDDCRNLIGLDLIGPVARLAGSNAADVLLLAVEVDEHHLATSTRPEPLGTHSAREVWRGLRGEIEETPREVLRAALREHVPDSARIATAIPDNLDEVASSALRRMLPSARDAWLVWRSVAAALVARGEKQGDFEEGDVVLVLDLDVHPPTITALTARHEKPGDPTPDGLYWERRPPFRIDGPEEKFDIWSMYEHAASRFFEDDHPPEFLREKLIDEGHLERGGPAQLLTRDASVWEHRVVQVDVETLWREITIETTRDVSWWLEGVGAEIKRIAGEVGDAHSCHLLVASQRGVALDEQMFECDFESLSHLSDADIARGCEIFLERHTNKLPTFRDMLPSITLKVGGTAIPLLDPEVLKQGVQPSQTLRFTPPQVFKLPKGKENIEMPLRTGEGQDREEFSAFVTDASFPLQRDVKVRIETRYRYAQDAFIVALLPVERASAPFDRIEIEWRRSQGEGTQQLIVNNEPPEFVTVGALAREDVDTLLSSKAVRRVCELVDRLQDSTKVHHRLDTDEASVLRDLESLEGLLKAIGKDLRKLIIPGQTGEPPGIEDLEEPLLALADIPEAQTNRRRGKKKGKSNYNRAGLKVLSKKLKNHQTRHTKALAVARDEATWTLASMRHYAPARLQPTILGEEHTDRHYHALGRMMRRDDGDGREDFDAFFKQLVEIEEITPDANLQHRLWCLATHLWSREEALFELDVAQVSALADFVREVASELESDWYKERISGELFRELGVIALALLRERGKGRGARFDANSEWCNALADSCAEITSKIEKLGFDKPPRIALGDQERTFIQILTESLKGHSVACIQLSDTDGE